MAISLRIEVVNSQIDSYIASYSMLTDEEIIEKATKWFHDHWKISLAGEKTNKRLVDIEQLEDQYADF